jgi:uncharacterized protein YbjT (DUF2867 family)
MCNARIAADDQGRAIAALLKHPEAHIGITIDLSGPSRWITSKWPPNCPKPVGEFARAHIDQLSAG